MSQPPLEYETQSEFMIHGKSVRVHLGTIVGPCTEPSGGATVRDHKGRVLARGIQDGFGERDPNKIWVMVDLSEAFTQKLRRGTSYHHSAELFEALGPLIAALPKSKWEKKGRPYKTPLQVAAEKAARREKCQRRAWGIPEVQPSGGWLSLLDRFPYEHPARKLIWSLEMRAAEQHLRDAEARWQKFAEEAEQHQRDAEARWQDARRRAQEMLEELFGKNTSTAEAVSILGLAGNYGPAEIQRAFRLKAKTAHPDVGGSAEEFRRITDARDTLLKQVAMH